MQCGKGFASLGALTLHIEQAGHTGEKNQMLLSSVQMTSFSATSDLPSHSLPSLPHGYPSQGSINTSHYEMQQPMPMPIPYPKPPSPYTINDGGMSKLTNSNFLPTTHPTPHPTAHPPHTTPFNPFYDNTPHEYTLYIASYSDRHSLTGGASYAIINDTTRTISLQEAFEVHQYYTNSEQPEYEALCEGLKHAIHMNILILNIKTSNQLIHMQLTNKYPSPMLLLESNQRMVSNWITKVNQLFQQIRRVQLDLVPTEYTGIVICT